MSILDRPLQRGDVIPMKAFTADYGDLALSYKKPGKRGDDKRYVFLLLGVEDVEKAGGEYANDILQKLGWTPPKAD